MTEERLLSLIAAFGADPDKWPASEQASGRQALEQHKDSISDILDDEQTLDDILSSAEPVIPPASLYARLMPADAATEDSRPSIASRLADLVFPQHKTWPVSAALACFIIGLVSGYTLPQSRAFNHESDALITAAFATEILFAALEEEDP